MAPRGMTGTQVVELLEQGEILNPRLLPTGSNYTFLVDVYQDGQALCQGVYKPRGGESPLWDFPDGTLYKREYAAFLLSVALGWFFVPPTVIRDGPHGVGAVVLYIHHDPRVHYFTLRQEYSREIQRICLFDLIANNADRKASHCLLGPDGRIWGIDHGLTFHAAPKLRTVIWDFWDQPIPAALLQDCQRLLEDLSAGRGAALALRDLIDPHEYDALQARLSAVLEHPVFPPPYLHTSLPWPWL